MIRHEQRHTSFSKKVQCSLCKATFIQKSDYYRHFRKQHIDASIPNSLHYVTEVNTGYRGKRIEYGQIRSASEMKNTNIKIDHFNLIEQTLLIDPYFGKLIFENSQ